MIEIPESLTLSSQLREAAIGKKIKSAVAGHSPHGFAWYWGDPAGYADLLDGKKIVDSRATAGYVEIEAEDIRVLLHDGVNVRYLEKGAARPDRHQLLLEFEDGGGIACTVQMYGGMYAFREGAFENAYYSAAKGKPSPLSDAFDWGYFSRLVKQAPAKLSAKGLLATEQRIPGLGNGSLQDILFAARVNPQSKVSALSDKDMKALYESLKDTLAAMANGGGRDTEKDLFGRPGGYRTVLSSKTLNNPCPGCGRAVTRKAYMGGNVYFCPSCQPVQK